MLASLAGLSDAKSVLRKTVTKGGDVDIAKLIDSEPSLDGQDKIREYFFQASVDEWYDVLQQFTFKSEFVPISACEAKVIIDHWNNVTSNSDESFEIPGELMPLAERIDEIIKVQFSTSHGVFVKLSTRSPKDSKTIFRKATKSFRARIADTEFNVKGTTSLDNARLVAMSEEMVKAAIVTDGREALTVLLDSWRVAEDLMYAHEDGKQEAPISLVIRAWDSRITPQCEFRGFVWDRKLNCIGQYWHSLYLPELHDLKDLVARDCLELFDKIKNHLPVPNAMLDLAWLGPGQVVLIEVNPLMEGLGSFKGSTGLFDFYADEDVLTGKAPFEIRIRTEEENRNSFISHMSLQWRSVVFGF